MHKGYAGADGAATYISACFEQTHYPRSGYKSIYISLKNIDQLFTCFTSIDNSHTELSAPVEGGLSEPNARFPLLHDLRQSGRKKPWSQGLARSNNTGYFKLAAYNPAFTPPESHGAHEAHSTTRF